jgi:hypothetical protein
MKRSNMDFQRILNAGKSNQEIVDLYAKLIREERIEAVKGQCDIIIVNEPVANCADTHAQWATVAENNIANARISIAAMIGEDYVDAAIQSVVDSNFTKFIMTSEIDEAAEYFNNAGIVFRLEFIEDDLFMAVSACDQTVNGEFYVKGKMLKPHCYKAVDMSSEFWKDN